MNTVWIWFVNLFNRSLKDLGELIWAQSRICDYNNDTHTHTHQYGNWRKGKNSQNSCLVTQTIPLTFFFFMLWSVSLTICGYKVTLKGNEKTGMPCSRGAGDFPSLVLKLGFQGHSPTIQLPRHVQERYERRRKESGTESRRSYCETDCDFQKFT